MKRSIEREWLDDLAADDPRALKSRRDMRRLNAWMGNVRIMARALQDVFSRHLAFRVVDIGAGDGEFLLGVARRLGWRWRGLNAVLVDRHDAVTAETRERFAGLKWQVRAAHTDAIQWVHETSAEKVEVIVANLFLHQFTDDQLRGLFRDAAGKTEVFVAVEPRRAAGPLLCSRLLRLIGCGKVTCRDAPISVRAGFRDAELSALWPDPQDWELTEHRAGWFSHLFVARRKAARTHAGSALFEPIVSAVFTRPTEPVPEPMPNTMPEPDHPSREKARPESQPRQNS